MNFREDRAKEPHVIDGERNSKCEHTSVCVVSRLTHGHRYIPAWMLTLIPHEARANMLQWQMVLNMGIELLNIRQRPTVRGYVDAATSCGFGGHMDESINLWFACPHNETTVNWYIN